MARGTYIYPPRPSIRLITDIFAFAAREVPKWNTISISGYHIREAGCDAVQEVAFTLADGIAYVEAAVARGARRRRLRRAALVLLQRAQQPLEEVAKFRAARRMWPHHGERFGAKTDRARALRFHCQTAGSDADRAAADNNVVRVTVQTLAAVLGGCQSLHTNSFDEALGLPTNESATIALRTQQIVAHESGVADFVDALGGELRHRVADHRIERWRARVPRAHRRDGRHGGAIEQGYPQREIQANSAYQYQLEIERKQRLIVGQNAFTQEAAPVPVEIANVLRGCWGEHVETLVI
jgi:methylmalonyl-CoA mutase N-terminal domain/subunit